jgi:collagenase-like PrtC family protease
MDSSLAKIELVSPAGGPEQLTAAINAGADAVYLGYRKYGARAYAGNFSFDQLRSAAEKSHASGRKIYLTLNTMLKDEEIPGLLSFLNNYLSLCRDGIIIQDMGLLKIIADLYPGVPLHASTQMNIHNTRSLDFAAAAGLARAVLAREMTLHEIRALSPQKDIKLEVFGHGSQCYGFSGICYFSSFTGGRSGNRGRCTQPCRMQYELVSYDGTGLKNISGRPSFLLSKNDICTLEILPGIIGAGVGALKIEGRMKTPEYVAIVTKIYRKYIDLYYSQPENYRVDVNDLLKISQIFSRGLGKGYYEGKLDDIVDPERSGSIGNPAGRIKKVYPAERNKKPAILIWGDMPIRIGDILEIWTKKGNKRLKVEKIQDRSAGKRHEHVIEIEDHESYSPKDRVFKYFDIKLDQEAGVLYRYEMPQKAVKKDMIKGIHAGERLKEYLEENLSNTAGSKKNAGGLKTAAITLRIYDIDKMEDAVNTGADNIMVSDLENLFNRSRQHDICGILKECRPPAGKIILDTPEIIYDHDMEKITESLEGFLGLENTMVRVSNAGLLEAVGASRKIARKDSYIILGSFLNISNTFSALFYYNFLSGIKGWEFSPEIDNYEIRDMISSLRQKFKNDPVFSFFSHGFFRVVTARHRIKYNRKGDTGGSSVFLMDRKKYKFGLRDDGRGNTNIFNSRKTCTIFDLDTVLEAGINDLVIDSIFTDIPDTTRLVKSYRKAVSLLALDRIDEYKRYADSLRDEYLFRDYSRGHLFRGVE